MRTICRFCGSKNFMRYGKRINKLRIRQTYKCRSCGRRFTRDDGFLYKRHDPDLITLSLDLWSKGLSLRQIRDHIHNFHDIRVAHTSILGWIQKYGEVIDNFTEALRPDLAGNWTADELVHYFNRNHNWIWNLMHLEKKYLIASEISAFRQQKTADKLFEKGLAKMNVSPKTVQTDGLANYVPAIRRTVGCYGTKHIRHAMRSKPSMNPMERLQGTCRDRIKTMRGFNSIKSARKAWKTWVNYYNFLRIHGALGRTPAEACGLDLHLEGNKWRDLIDKSVNGGVW